MLESRIPAGGDICRQTDHMIKIWNWNFIVQHSGVSACLVHGTLHIYGIVAYTLFSVHIELCGVVHTVTCTVLCTMHDLYFTNCIVNYTLCTVLCSLYSLQSVLYWSNSTLYRHHVHLTLHTVHTVHYAHWTLHSTV